MGEVELMDAVSDHFEKHVSEIHLVFHEIVSDLVHVDVHWIQPCKRYPFHTLFTTGMAEAPMTVPEGVEHRYAEMVTMLPPDWRLSQDDFKDEANYWPIRWLKECARLPHTYDTWLGPGHTIPNGDPPEPMFKGSGIRGIMAAIPTVFPEEAWEIDFKGRPLQLLYMLPLTGTELKYKLEHGSDALCEKIDHLGLRIPDLAGSGRPCSIDGKRARRWWPFG